MFSHSRHNSTWYCEVTTGQRANPWQEEEEEEEEKDYYYYYYYYYYLVVTDCPLNFYTVCAASLTSYCYGMWVTGSWI